MHYAKQLFRTHTGFLQADFKFPVNRFQDESEARRYLEGIRWGAGARCAHCGSENKSTRLNTVHARRSRSRPGVHQCNVCRKQFSVTTGTIFEDSNLPPGKWLYAIDLMCGGARGRTAVEIRSALELGSYRTAWRLCGRIRWAMQQEPLRKGGPAKGPVRIPLVFEDALRGLLRVKPESRDRPQGERRIGAKLEKRSRSG